MKVLVTGGSGFIGSATVNALLRQGYDVVNVDLRPPVFAERHYSVDVTDEVAMRRVVEVERPDKVIHLAAHISVPESVAHPINDMRQNIAGSLAVFEAARHTGVKRLLFASSAAVYGDSAVPPIAEGEVLAPFSPYGISKWTVEQYLQGFYHQWFSSVIFRYANVFGPRQSPEGGAVIAKFVDGAVRERCVTIYGDGSAARDFIHVDDVAAANVLALESEPSMLVNLGSGLPVTVLDLVHQLEHILGERIEIRYAADRPGDIHSSYYDVKRMKEVLNWAPEVSLQDGLRGLVEEKQAAVQRERGRL